MFSVWQKWVALGLIGVIKCQTGFKLSSYWGKHVLHSVQNGSFLAGTYLHTHILPVYHFVLDFLICCPRRGQNGIGAGDRNRGQGQYACTPVRRVLMSEIILLKLLFTVHNDKLTIWQSSDRITKVYENNLKVIFKEFRTNLKKVFRNSLYLVIVMIKHKNQQTEIML